MANKEEYYLLKIEEIIERLRTNDRGIIDDIYNMALTLFESEEKRMKVIDTKGNYIMGIAGIALSLMFALAGYHPDRISSSQVILVLYFITFMSFIGSLMTALYVIAPRSDYKTVNEENLFNKKEINEGQNVYRRFITTHIWTIFQNNFRINERKGRRLRWAYRLLSVSNSFFILLVLLIISQ
ncbi:hypothetical protein ES705_21904 [subsurface metagenome]